MSGGVDAPSDAGTASTVRSSISDSSTIEEELEKLWSEFKTTGSAEARDRLIVHYAPLVKYVVGRMSVGVPASIDHEDLTSAGIVGLMEAVSKFEPGRGYKFETYAASRIRGAILDDLRAMDWVPRSVRTQARRVEEALQKLSEGLGRTPTDEEVAAEMGVSVRKLRSIYSRVSTVLFVSLERLMSLGEKQGALSLVDTLADAQAEDPAAHVETEEMRRFLTDAIKALPERERLAITLYYYEGLSLTEIAQVVGLSQARISQMNAKSVLQFRSMLTKSRRR
ncbi:MAG: FliA/WhiG family RNA polymerase sigma factor [Actinomycetota bacterium]|nr:FliA/WhiG family RNA polymerase sigma factor [Actinomycetota bacterium]